MTNKMTNKIAAAFVALTFFLPAPLRAQGVTPGLPLVPLGNCQMTASGTAAALSTCTRASFTGSGSGNTLTASSVTGTIKVGDTVTGTGVPAGTTITALGTGTGGAGTYITSAATTSSSASLTSGGIPHLATLAVIIVETANIRWRDDGGVPTTSIGMLIPSASAPYTYIGTLTAFQLIAVSGSPVVDIAFYKSP